jgi:hypothetical protein
MARYMVRDAGGWVGRLPTTGQLVASVPQAEACDWPTLAAARAVAAQFGGAWVTDSDGQPLTPADADAATYYRVVDLDYDQRQN